MRTLSSLSLIALVALFLFRLASQAYADTTECYKDSVGKTICPITVEKTASGSSKVVITLTPTSTPTPSPTRTPTPTVTPSSANSSGQPKHTVVNTGLQENIIAILVIGFALSAFGYQYAKARA